VADNFGTDLHQFFPLRGSRPIIDLLLQSRRPHEIAGVVSQGVKPQPDGIVRGT